eukprot:contig_27987_g6888
MADRDGWGGKTGGGGAASASVTNVARLSRLRSLTQDTVDLRRDPYFLRNHLGSVECKLCLSLHATDGGYLAHTAGRRHQTNLARRAAREAARGGGSGGGWGAPSAGWFAGGRPVCGLGHCLGPLC